MEYRLSKQILVRKKMINKYITATILAIASSGVAAAQVSRPVPRLVVNIAIDQLRTDYMEAFMPSYGNNGFKKLLQNGIVYHNAQYTFAPVDRASSIASIVTGTSPSNNGITGLKWLDKNTLIPVNCVDDHEYDGIFTKKKSSPKNIATTTINDELKISTDGAAVVYSIAMDRDAAVIGGGHAADGAIWFDEDNKCWCSSKYYFNKAPQWLEGYNLLSSNTITVDNINSGITSIALQCVSSCGMGKDNVPDMLSLTYDAKVPIDKDVLNKQLLQYKYVQLDKELEKLISGIESKVGKSNVLFVVTSTGYCNEKEIDYARYRIPSGTFYVNRTANLLNMYLGAIYGQDKYVESCFYNQIFLNIKQIEQKRINTSELLSRAQTFIMQLSGVSNVFTSKNLLLSGDNNSSRLRNWFFPNNCGDLVIEVSPGWKLINEENFQQYTSKESTMPFPLVFYGTGVVAEEVTTPITIDRIAPTIAKAIRIRAPNACSVTPLH